MAKYETRKETAAYRQVTLDRKQVRKAKYQTVKAGGK